VKISVLCSSEQHPIHGHLQDWKARRGSGHEIEIANSTAQLRGGELLFLISCNEIVRENVRSMYRHSLVVHASDLPKGRGWSPHIWQVLEGSRSIPVTLLEAQDTVDSGSIWSQRRIELEGHELFDEINARLFAATLELMDFAVDNAGKIEPVAQANAPATYYRRRTPEDSRLDPQKSIAEQFDLLRVADTDRFPCFFEFRGKRFRVHLRKESES
jgi:methionyl-tRNA formyltransferase